MSYGRDTIFSTSSGEVIGAPRPESRRYEIFTMAVMARMEYLYCFSLPFVSSDPYLRLQEKAG